jgi:hypothetical protein
MFDSSTLHRRQRLHGGNIIQVHYAKHRSTGQMHPVRVIKGGQIVHLTHTRQSADSTPTDSAPKQEEKVKLRKKIFMDLKL